MVKTRGAAFEKKDKAKGDTYQGGTPPGNYNIIPIYYHSMDFVTISEPPDLSINFPFCLLANIRRGGLP